VSAAPVTEPVASPSTRRSLMLATWGLMAAVGMVLLSGGMFSTLIGVRAELEGLPTVLSGAISGAYYAGFLVGSRFALRALGKVGHIRVFAALTAMLSAAVLGIGLLGVPVMWLVLRAVTGLCFAGMYVVAESWLNGLASNEFRGRLLATYSVIVAATYGAGQLAVFDFDARAVSGYAIAAIIASLAVVPVAMSEQATVPEAQEHARLSMRELARIVPTGMATNLLVGLAHGAMMGMAAVYATREGLSVGRTGLLLAALQLGGMVMTFPVSAASDEIDRRVVGVVACLGAMGAGGLLLLGPASSPMAVFLMILVGGFSYPLYSIASAYTNDWLDPEQLSAAASQLVTLYGIGAMIGPFVGAGFIEVLGTQGYLWSIVVLHGFIAVFLAYRIRTWHAPLTTRSWSEASVPARAFFVPANIVSMGIHRRRRPHP
jgi:MFS family permease